MGYVYLLAYTENRQRSAKGSVAPSLMLTVYGTNVTEKCLEALLSQRDRATRHVV